MMSSEWKRCGKEAWASLVTRDYKPFFNHILFGLPLAKEKVRLGNTYNCSWRKNNSCFVPVQNLPDWSAFLLLFFLLLLFLFQKVH